MKKTLSYAIVFLLGTLLMLFISRMETKSSIKLTAVHAGDMYVQDSTEVPNPVEGNGEIGQRLIKEHGNIFDLAWSPDGTRLAIADSSGAWVYEVNNFDKAPLFFESQSGHITAIAFASDSVTLGYGDDTGSVHLWNIDSLVDLAQIQTHVGTIWDIDFGIEGLFVLAGDNGEVQLRETTTGELLNTSSSSLPIYSVAFSPDGTLVSFVDGTPDFGFQARVFIWNIKRNQKEVVFWSKNALLFSVTFNSTGKILAFGGASLDKDGTVEVFDLADNTQMVELIASGSYINCIAFSPFDNTMAYATGDSKIFLWKPNDSSAAKLLYEGSENISSLAFSPDGALLASGGTDGIIRLWRMEE